jgi:site-specific DNA-methyltransferase (adenine-specific)
MGKAWDGADIEAATRHNAEVKPPRTDGRTVARDSASMYAGSYDLSPTGNQAFQRWCHEWATEALRILKPGGHLLAFGGTRTYHRLACAVEDAGFEIRDQVLTINGKGVAEPSGMLAWIYGSG